MDNNLEIIQVNEQLELHLGYVGGQSVGGIQEETDPIYTADKPNIALKSEIPVKVSDLQNDSGFISSIPQNLVTQEELQNKGYLTEFTQNDPVYSKDKPNLALKSELFSKSYNDLTDKPTIPNVDGLASEKYVDDKVANIEIPTKTSDLQNDSGFITVDNIPEVQISETDPIYSKDKPNIALKSELFSKDYNDLSNKPDLYTPKTDGEGNKFLADDGTYKTVETSGGGDSVDLSNYTTENPINVKIVNSEGKVINGIQIDGDYACYGKMSYTTYIDFNAQYFKFWNNNTGTGYSQSGVDFSSTYNVKLPEDTTINGMKLKLNQQKYSYGDTYITIYPTSNQFIEYVEIQQQMSLYIWDNTIHDFTVVFSTGSECTVDISVTEGIGFIINKPFNFQTNKKYILFQHYNLIVWSEIQNYE